jgi:hypothetical protein
VYQELFRAPSLPEVEGEDSGGSWDTQFIHTIFHSDLCSGLSCKAMQKEKKEFFNTEFKKIALES